MKKIRTFLATLLPFVLIFSLAACGDNVETGGDASQEESLSAEGSVSAQDGEASGQTEEASGQTEEASDQTEETSGQTEEASGQTGEAANQADAVTLKVGASSTPHAEILEIVKPLLAEQGITLEIVIYDDYVLPNTALQDGTLDANYFQHRPYLNSFNESNGTDLVSAGLIHYEPFGIYSHSVTDLKALPQGAAIIVSDDDSNQTRALLLLAQEGLVKLPEGASVEEGVTILDIVEDNGYQIQAAQADAVPTLLKNSAEGTIAVINYNYALGAGFKTTDALAIEDASGDAAQTYANVIAVRRGDEEKEAVKALVKALQEGAIDQYNQQTGAGIVAIK